jgi:hypothetical protein
MTARKDHNPTGSPNGLCESCGGAWHAHRVGHKFAPAEGTPGQAPGWEKLFSVEAVCSICSLPSENHRPRSESGTRIRTRNETGGRKRSPGEKKRHREKGRRNTKYFVGVDGEGRGEDNEKHRYVLLCASDEHGNHKWHIENDEGLGTVECLDFLLDLPLSCKAFAFSFNYDLTMILKDVGDRELYELFRPDLRQRPAASPNRTPYPVHWNGYKLNLQGTKFTVAKGKRHRVVWDVFKFYGTAFVVALEAWKVNLQWLPRMKAMKEKRKEFEKVFKSDPESVKTYCFEECMSLAELVRRLVEAHKECDLKLKAFYGAGSTASAILKKLEIRDKRGDGGPADMSKAVASAFFGGRFEHSCIGPIPGPVYSYDISSAYPYQTCFLPCLVHGKWKLTTNRKELKWAQAACVHYEYNAPETIAWAPFPFRDTDGSIIYPARGAGWIWKDEYLAGEKYFPGVKFVEAWVYETKCKCEAPFKAIPEYYIQRLLIGKEGAGIVLKLGPNSVYGKLAQSIGLDPPFQCWIWAGMITSGCRAQLLELVGRHKNRWNLRAVATDGAYTTERLHGATKMERASLPPEAIRKLDKIQIPQPRNTGTFDALNDRGEPADKPLGGWEAKVVDKGVFFVRPGIYFPLDPTEEELKDVRARGIGRGAMHKSWRLMVDGWAKGLDTVQIPSDAKRFVGAKNAISVRQSWLEHPFSKKKSMRILDGTEYNRSESYGQWEPREIELTFDPRPKREQKVRMMKGVGRLYVKRMKKGAMSKPYKAAELSEEAIALKKMQEEALEQPDGCNLTDFSEPTEQLL